MKTTEWDMNIKNIKRCRIKGDVFSVECPECGNTITEDMSSMDNYISYPEIWHIDSVSIYCETCDEYVTVDMKIISAKMVIEYDEKSVRMDR